jgi:hypothetical protein
MWLMGEPDLNKCTLLSIRCNPQSGFANSAASLQGKYYGKSPGLGF